MTSRETSSRAFASSPIAIGVCALALTALALAHTTNGKDDRWVGAHVETNARGDGGRERVTTYIAFEDDDVKLSVKESERERAREDVDGEVGWYRARVRDEEGGGRADDRRAALAALSARRERWERDDAQANEDVGEREFVVDFDLPPMDSARANARASAEAGEILRREAALGADPETEIERSTRDMVHSIASASMDETLEAMATVDAATMQLLSANPKSTTAAKPAAAKPAAAPAASKQATPAPEVVVTALAPKVAPATASVWATVAATNPAPLKTTTRPEEFQNDVENEAAYEHNFEAPVLRALTPDVEEPEVDELTAALSSSKVTYKKKIDTTIDVNMYENALRRASGDDQTPKSYAQMGWKPSDAEVLTEDNIKANEAVEKETLSVDFLSRFPVHLPKSARETQTWKPFAMSDLKSAREKEDTVERVTEAAVELVRAQQSEESRNRSGFMDVSIYIIGPLGLFAFVAVFYGVVALVVKKKKEGSNAQTTVHESGDSKNDENSFLNFVRATTIRHSNDKQSGEKFGLASSLMSMLNSERKVDVDEESDALLAGGDSKTQTHRPSAAVQAMSANVSGTSTPVIVDEISDSVLVNRTLSAIRTREWTPPSSTSGREESVPRSSAQHNVAVTSNDEPKAKTQSVLSDVPSDDDAESRKMVAARQASRLSTPSRPVSVKAVSVSAPSVSAFQRVPEQTPDFASTGAGRRARTEPAPTVVRSMTTKFY